MSTQTGPSTFNIVKVIDTTITNKLANGYSNIALGSYSHAEGLGTIASGSYQTVSGRYNKQNNSSSLFIIGNGISDNNRKDLVLFNTDGIVLSGSITFGAGSVISENWPDGAPNNSIDIVAGPNGYAELASHNTQSFMWVDNNGSYIVAGGSPQWTFDNTGSLTAPGNIHFTNGTKIILNDGGQPGSIDLKASAGGWAELQSYDSNQYMWVDDGGAYIGTNWLVGGKGWTFDRSGSLTVPGNIIGAPNLATTGSNTFSGTQYVLSDIKVSNGNKIYNENISGITPQPGISSYSDPITQLTTQGDFSGETIKGVAGEGLEPGQLIYLYTDGLWYKANATPDGTNGNPSATNLLGIVVSDGGSPIMINDDFTILLQGNIYTNQIVGGEAPGSPLWIDTTVGFMRNPAPASSGNIVRQVGHVLTTHVLRFNPDNYYSIV